MADNLYFYKGRVALYAILTALGLHDEDEVILPGFTCVVVPNAIKYIGAKPVYVDIGPKSYNIDAGKIEQKITGKTRAIIAQHTFGIPADMDEIMGIAGKYNLYVIEDSCHVAGSKYKGREVGTYGDAAFFSSQWSKPVTTGLGGWVKINNAAIETELMKIYPDFSLPSFKEDSILKMEYLLYSALMTPALFWFIQDAYRTLSKYGIAVGSSTNEELECRMPANYAKRMTGWQEKTITKKLGNLDAMIEHRRHVAAQYKKMLPQAGIERLKLPKSSDTVFLRYPVLVGDKSGILALAKKNRIEMGDWFLSPVHPNLSGWEKVSYEKGMCPNAEWVCDHVINLPTHQGITEREIEKTVGFISSLRGLL